MGIIPAPLFVENREGQHTLVDQVRIACDGKGTDAVGQYLADHLEYRYEHQASVDIAEPSSSAGDGDILLTRVTEPLASLADLAVPSEAYELEVAEDCIVIRALENHGLFNGVQTLIQLLPATATLDALSLQCVKARAVLVIFNQANTWSVVAYNFLSKLLHIQITDSPRFAWRGVLLDVGRHYFSVPFHKKFLDAMAFHKMNKFHWHLTEDQVHHFSLMWTPTAVTKPHYLPVCFERLCWWGVTTHLTWCLHVFSIFAQGWRLEVKSYPRLTEHGAWRGREGSSYGGFYSQEEVRQCS